MPAWAIFILGVVVGMMLMLILVELWIDAHKTSKGK